ncbi:DDE-type integrase/transposase/recombinase [Propionivibrio dicarboxylicus]|uniref:Integrase core domain-containing protein n=1 Tax=Propionivibrio dicarboxylicus TaxID=83767 RepID=A0A1G7V9D6_9RHOO|nr:DDE-type integrase/transposase/recombinase [Propionivibrio dicarboxylicus]SDG56337.1 Integrase core domain-containing protein [Propionivibrio dicarboxylicus]
MGHFYFEKGLVVKRLGQFLEYSSRCGDELYFENPETGKRETIEESSFWEEQQTGRLAVLTAFSSPKALLLPEEPEPTIDVTLADIPEKHQDEVIRRHDYISRLKAAGITKGQKQLIREEAEKIAKEIDDPRGVPSESTLRRWWRLFEKNSYNVFALVNKNARKSPAKRLDGESEKYLQDNIEEVYLQPTRPGGASAYRQYKDTLERENSLRQLNGEQLLTLVSERTYLNRIKLLPKEEVLVARLGREAARHTLKMIKGHLPADFPLDCAELDHTPMNLYVIDDRALLPLGRPWLTAIKDRRTGMLLGFFISFHQTGLRSIFGAIKHSLLSHNRAYEIWPELENPWPAHGCAVKYVSDRGADFLSKRCKAAILSLGSGYEHCERRTPWLKASIERFFLTLEQTFFEMLPGRTFSCLKERGDYDPAKDAVIRVSTLAFLLHKWAVDHHNVFPNKRTQEIPLLVWKELVGVAPPPYPASIDALDIILGERHTGCLSHEGIRFQWLNYADDTLAEMMKQLGRDTRVDYVVSSENLGQIHVQNPRTKEYILVPCTRPDYAQGLSLHQHKCLRKEAGVRLKAVTAVDTLRETRLMINDRIREEIANKENIPKARLAKLAEINSNAILNGESRTILTPFAGQQLSRQTPLEIKQATAPITDIPIFAWGI